MKLEDVILNLPKSKDLISNLKKKIYNEFELIDKLFDKIKSVNLEINMEIKFDLKDSNKLKSLNKLLIDSNELVGKIALSNKKIKEYKINIDQIISNKNFNSEWIGGKVPGELIDTVDGYRIRFDGQSRSFKYKNIINSDKLIGCADKQDCKIKAEKYLYDYYNNLEKIANKYRFVSPDIIEIQLTQDKTFITNSKFLNFISQYRIGLKHDKRSDRYYITYVESSKVNKLFSDLISGISKIKLSNGCDFDLREENLIESDNKIIGLEFVSKLNSDSIDTELDLNKKTNQDGLPMYQWIKGKFAGTVFQRKDQNKWTVVVKKPDGGVITKTLSFDANTKDSVYKEAIGIRNNLSDMYGLTTNKIKILDGDKIEVKLSKDQIMTTDYKFLNIIEKYPIYSSKSEGENSKYYASMMIGNEQKQFHNFITSWDMVDHIDRNPLNNCLNNLRETTHKENNNNRNKSESSNAIELGVTYSAKDDAYKARIKQDGREYCKQFSVKKYGKDEALRLAIETRRDFNKAFNCLNG
jgi:hypothetical protein